MAGSAGRQEKQGVYNVSHCRMNGLWGVGANSPINDFFRFWFFSPNRTEEECKVLLFFATAHHPFSTHSYQRVKVKSLHQRLRAVYRWPAANLPIIFPA